MMYTDRSSWPEEIQTPVLDAETLTLGKVRGEAPFPSTSAARGLPFTCLPVCLLIRAFHFTLAFTTLRPVFVGDTAILS